VLTRIINWLHQTEKIIYFVIAIALASIAVVLLIWGAVDFVQNVLDGTIIGEAVLHALDSLLLVIMLVEILHTVQLSLQGQMLKIEPFMLVGIIAAVRRILIVTAEQGSPSAEHAAEFQLAMLELGILTVMILALVGAVAIMRKIGPDRETTSVQLEQPDREKGSAV